MYQDTQIGVVVPAYNEEGFVGDVIETVPEFVDRIYVVDDASTDGTWQEILRHADGDPETTEALVGDGGMEQRRVVPIRHTENRGVGGAIKTGYQRALTEGMGVVTVLGADGQMDPDLLERVIDPVVTGQADYAKGNRLLYDEHHDEMPGLRYVGNTVLTYLTRIASGYWGIGDPQNGYTAISRRALQEADIDNMYEFYGYCNDLLVKLNVEGLRVVDVPTPAVYGEEESHISLTTYVPRVSGMLFRNFLWRMRAKYVDTVPHPVAIAYALGGLSWLGALLSILPGFGGAGSAALGFAAGLVCFLLAMLLDMRSNEHLAGVAAAPAR